MVWHVSTVQQVFDHLRSGKNGLSAEEAALRKEKYGPNQLVEGKRRSKLSAFFAQFKDVMIIILLLAAIVSGILGDLTDTIVIMVIVVLNAVLGFIQEMNAEKAMDALKAMAVSKTNVLREGQSVEVPATDLVPGDIVMLETGNIVPADLRLVESVNLRVEEASLTGESVAVEKHAETTLEEDIAIGDMQNMAFKSTTVTYGRGSGIVVATGMETELGNIAKMLQGAEMRTPLQEKMALFGKRLTVLVILICALFFLIGWLRGEAIGSLVMTSISMAVAAIPEALPAAITISLALAARRMIKVKALIRKLPAVETLGSVTFICTDKTGTLTKNEMHTEEVFVNENFISASEIKSDPSNEDLKQLLNAFALNNDTIENDNGEIKGDSTEIALMKVAADHDIHRNAAERIAEIPFDSTRKLMTTFHPYDGRIVAITKGAPDVLLAKCNDIDPEKIAGHVNEMAAKGERVIGFAYRLWESLPELDAAVVEKDLNFSGLAGLVDPPREEAGEAIKECKQAGIQIVMITGDHPETAKNIAERLGILVSGKDLLLTGRDIARLEEQDFENKVESIKVYARVSPEQKLNIVKALQKKGHYVAMTGDGVNDAPSLKRANIGIAMGITGTDVSREASDMVLMDDNFSTIVKAVREGRRIYDNILKFIKYLMTTNSGELFTLLIGPLLGLPVALLPIHILWINLVSDGLPAISLSFEKAERDIMRRPPRHPDETVFAKGRGLHMIWVGLFMACIALFTQWWAIENDMPWQTMVFNVLCLCQLGHVMAIRSESRSLFKIGLFSNMQLLWAVLTGFILQIAITYIPWLQPVFKTEALTLNQFILVGFLSSLVFFVVELEKMITRRRRKLDRSSK